MSQKCNYVQAVW